MNKKADDDKKYDFSAKMLIIGDSGVGKTSLLLRYCDQTFTHSHLPTIGIDFKIKTIKIDDERLKVRIWDTAGQERFKTITSNFYKGSSGVIMTYSCNDRTSFSSVEGWLKQLNEFTEENICKILVGNKCDMIDRKVTYDEGKKLASSYKIKFFETSAKEDINVQEAFEWIARDVIESLRARASVIDDPDRPSLIIVEPVPNNCQSKC